MSSRETQQPTVPLGRAVRLWFFRPPRPHGQVLTDRSVGHLELFYDLVFVVFVGRLAHHLADHVATRGVVDFAALFGVMWLTWYNGSLYHELHGREDGRARGLMFIQMLLLGLLSVYAPEAGGEDGSAFAWVLAVLLAVQTFQWWTVYLVDDPSERGTATRYIAGSLIVIAVTIAAALVESPDTRLAMWAALLGVGIGGGSLLLGRLPRENRTFIPTPSLAERFGLFVIIVLGEVVVGMVDGLGAIEERDTHAILTGLVALTLSFGFWWTYFDLVGERLPRQSPRAFVTWQVIHLPLTLFIAAAGAGLVSLIEHAPEAHTSQPTAWLVAGSVAGVLLTCVPLARTIGGPEGAKPADSVLPIALVVGAAVSLLIGALHPAPWLLALLLLLVLIAVWTVGFIRWLKDGGAAELIAAEAS